MTNGERERKYKSKRGKGRIVKENEWEQRKK